MYSHPISTSLSTCRFETIFCCAALTPKCNNKKAKDYLVAQKGKEPKIKTETKIYRVCRSTASDVIIESRADFRIFKNDIFHCMTALLNEMSRQFRGQDNQVTLIKSEQLLISEFSVVKVDSPLMTYSSFVNSKTIDPKNPNSFANACEFSACYAATDHEYNVILKRNTW